MFVHADIVIQYYVNSVHMHIKCHGILLCYCVLCFYSSSMESISEEASPSKIPVKKSSQHKTIVQVSTHYIVVIHNLSQLVYTYLFILGTIQHQSVKSLLLYICTQYTILYAYTFTMQHRIAVV